MSLNDVDAARRIFGHDIVRNGLATLDPFGDDRDARRSYRSVQLSTGKHHQDDGNDNENDRIELRIDSARIHDRRQGWQVDDNIVEALTRRFKKLIHAA